MKYLFIIFSLLAVNCTFAASKALPIRGLLISFDKKYAKVANLTGEYSIPVEYFSNLKKISLGSEVEVSLDEAQGKKVKFSPPPIAELKP